MVNKKFLLSLFFLTIIAMFLTLVNALSVSLVNPKNNYNVSGPTYQLQAYINESATPNIGSVSFYFQPWSYTVTGNKTWIFITTITNTSENQSVFTYSWNTLQAASGSTHSKNFSLNATATDYNTGLVTVTGIRTNITIDNGAPVISVIGYTNGTIKTSLAQPLSLNVFVFDNAVGLYNSSNSFCFIDVNGVNNSVPLLGGTGDSRWCNTSSLSLAGLGEGNKTINIWANDTLGNILKNSNLVVQIDTVVPTASASCTSTVKAGDSFPCSCITSDATTGINNASSGGSSNSPDGISIPNTLGTFIYTCTATDNGGLVASSNATYVVIAQNDSSSSSNGANTTSSSTPQVNQLSKIIPGANPIVQYSDPELVLRDIEISVKSEANNVRIDVVKYNNKPDEVLIEKTGKVYQYMQIDVSNVEDKLSKATLTLKVKKSWVTSNKVNKNNMALYKFDGNSLKWNELPTKYVSEDLDNYYYEASLTSFSYFAMAEKESSVTQSSVGSNVNGKALWALLWIVIGAVILVLLTWLALKRERKAEGLDDEDSVR